MSGILIHLSDIHFADSSDPVLSKAKGIAQCAVAQCPEASFYLIVASGDIAQSGSENEYRCATDFFTVLKSELEQLACPSAAKRIHLLSVPGNHDCDFRANNDLRDVALKQLPTAGIGDGSLVERALEINSNYYRFEEGLTGIVRGSGEKFVKTVQIATDEGEITFHLINSAFTSSLKQDSGRLWMPVRSIEDHATRYMESLGSRTPTIISVFHHPYNWYTPDVSRALKRVIEATSDIVITGHEHDHETYIRVCELASTTYIEGDVLQERSTPEICGFNVVTLDISNRKRFCQNYQWNDSQGAFAKNDDTAGSWQLFNRMSDSHLNQNRLTDEWLGRLQDPEMTYRHPKIQGRLNIDQIYIYPDLTVRDPGRKEDETIKSGNVPGFFVGRQWIVVVGPSDSGKTTLCKSLYRELISQGFVPLMAKGVQLKDKPGRKDHISKLADKLYEAQYEQKNPKSSIWAVPRTKRCVIIDDFFVSDGDSNRADTIKSLKELFGKIIITGSSDLLLDELFSSSSNEAIIGTFTRADIKQFGHLLRSKFIENWNKIGRQADDERDEEIRRQTDSEKLLAGIMGKNLIPSYPMYILMVLQAISSGGADKIGEAAYGPLYNRLIIDDLSQAYSDPADIDTATGMLSLLAIAIRTEGSESISRLCFKNVVKRFNDEYGDTLNPDAVLKELCKCGVLKNDEMGDVSFSYPYYRYFFLSKYLCSDIKSESNQALLSEMLNDLYDEENANTLLFVSSMSQDQYLIRAIVEVANSLFINESRFDFACREALPKSYDPSESGRILIEPENHKIHRDEHLENRDEHDELHNSRRKRNSADVSERVKQYCSSYKTVQMIGQILAHSAGSIKLSDKEIMLKSGYDLALRVLGAFYSMLNEKIDEIGSSIAKALSSLDKKLTQDEERIIVNRIIGGIIESMAFAVISHCADCFGHKKLDTALKNSYPPSSRTSADDLLLLAIAIEKSPPFPSDLAVEIYDGHKKNPFATAIIRSLVQQRFHLYEVPMKTIQSVCSRIGIEIKSSSPYFNRSTKL
jgi:energy-coupling factor transporter ATP-binding protein EcfA2